MSITKFAIAISKFKVKNVEENAEDDKSKVRINNTGFIVSKVLAQLTSIRPLLQDIISRLPQTMDSAQPMIGISYSKIVSLLPYIKGSSDLLEKQISQNGLFLKGFASISEYMTSISQYIPQLCCSNAPKMCQYLDGITESLHSILDVIDDMISTIYKIEASLISQLNEKPNEIQMIISSILVSLEFLLIDIVFLVSHDISKEFKNKFGVWIQNINGYSEKFLSLISSGFSSMSSYAAAVLSELPKLSLLLNDSHAQLTTTIDFSHAIITLDQLYESLNIIETKLIIKGIDDVFCNIVSLYSSQKNMKSYIQIIDQILSGYKERMQIGEMVGYSKSIISAYNALRAVFQKPDNVDLHPFMLISACRLLLHLIPDYTVIDGLLFDLLQTTFTLSKVIFIDGKKIITEISTFIEDNLGFFDEKLLAETNYILTTIKSIEDIDNEAPDYMSAQQVFFDMFCSVPSSLQRLISSCKDSVTISTLSPMLKKCSMISNNYAKWIHQYYLTIMSSIVIKSEDISDCICFPMSCITGQSSQIDLSLNRFKAVVESMSQILSLTPQCIAYDYNDIIKLVGCIEDIIDTKGDFIKIVSALSSSPYYNVLHSSTVAFSKMNFEIKSVFKSISTIISAYDNNGLLFYILSMVSRSIAVLKENESGILNLDNSMPYHLSMPSSFLLSIDCISQDSNSNSLSIAQLTAPLKSSFGFVWGISMSISQGFSTPDSIHTASYMSSALKNANEIINSVFAQPQPQLFYKMPEGMLDIKKFEEMAALLPSALLKQFSSNVVRIMKKSTSNDVRLALNEWFESAKKPKSDYASMASELTGVCKKMLVSANNSNNRKPYIVSSSAYSVSMVSCENNFGQSLSPIISEYNKQFIELSTQYLESPRHNNLLLMRVVTHIQQTWAFSIVSKLKPKDVDDYLSQTLSSIIQCLHVLRGKAKDIKIDDAIEAIKGLRELEALYIIFPTFSTLEFGGLMNSLLSGKPKKSEIDQYVKYFSEKIAFLLPSVFKSIERIRDKDSLTDIAYAKSDQFQESLNGLLASSTEKGIFTQEMTKDLNLLVLLSSSISLLSYHSLVLSDSVNTIQVLQYINGFSNLFISLIKFSDLLLKLKKTKGTDPLIPIKSLSKTIFKEFDRLVIIIESPKLPETQTESSPEFFELLTKMFGNFGGFIFHLSRELELASYSLVPEMYQANQQMFAEGIQNHMKALSSSVKIIKTKAIGNSAIDLGNIFESIENYTSKLLKLSTTIKVGESVFPVQSLFEITSSICNSLLKLHDISTNLTDQLVIQPDPEAASKVPDDYSILPLPNKIPPTSQSWDELQKANKGLCEYINIFKQEIEPQTANSATLINSITTLRKHIDSFGLHTTNLIAGTSDLRARVGLQASMYSWAANVTNVQNAIRSRLLRVPSYDEEMRESLEALGMSTSRVLSLADEASRTILEADVSMDEVTKHLLTTAREVETLSARIFDFGNRVSMEGVTTEQVEEPEKTKPKKTPTKKGSKGKSSKASTASASGPVESLPTISDTHNCSALPGFLIASATPILQCTSQIMLRSKEITSQLLKKNGKLDNESGLVRAAQDLSEASKLIFIVAELLTKAHDDDTDFKVIAAARIIKAAVAALVAQVLVKGGDSEGIVNGLVKQVTKHADNIIKVTTKIVDTKLDDAEKKEPKKKQANQMIQRINLQQEVNNQRKVLENEEKKLYQFRKKV